MWTADINAPPRDGPLVGERAVSRTDWKRYSIPLDVNVCPSLEASTVTMPADEAIVTQIILAVLTIRAEVTESLKRHDNRDNLAVRNE